MRRAFRSALLSTHLLIIDPQIDFMDLPGASLPVRGADADMRRLAAFIRVNGRAIDGITLTFDSHELLDIGHPGFWRTPEGAPPPPFTQASHADVAAGRLVPADPSHLPRVLAYLLKLEAQGRYRHMIWPVHCQIGTQGHNLHPEILDACNAWEAGTGRPVVRVLKGLNRFTEHYSAVRAEVVDPQDPHTDTNQALLDVLLKADRLLVAGEALSHCVKATVEDVIAAMDPRDAGKVSLLTDAMSAVPGFEAQAEAFVHAMSAAGVRLATTVTWHRAA
ncbi:hypothetical protein B1810_06325 [Panacagrimonas perspica]|nr:hypothetical protein B1810_06325 [Panacagrimonas perspica]